MNRFVARSVIRALMVNSRSCGGSNRMLYAATTATVRPWEISDVGRGGDFGAFNWRRMMSSQESSAVEEVKKEKSAVEQAKKDSSGDKMMLSSYWGISRPKITRKDGTEWPWNCFMVLLTHLPFLFFVDHYWKLYAYVNADTYELYI